MKRKARSNSQHEDVENLMFDQAAYNRVGLVAGWGSFPLEVARRFRKRNVELHIVGLCGHADPRLEELADRFVWKGVAKLGAQIDFFVKGSVQHVAFAGKLFKSQLLHHGLGWIQLLPDWTCARTLASVFLTRSSDGRDDTILGKVVGAYGKKGINILSIHEVAPELLISEGILGGRKLSRSQLADVRFGWLVARKMGDLDIGQSVTVRDQMVLGVEAIEGTDALIERTGKLCPRGGFTLVKIAKPNQDMRFDVPTVGPGTVAQMAAAGGSLIVVEAGKTILVDRDETLKTARRKRVTIAGLDQAAFSDSCLPERQVA